MAARVYCSCYSHLASSLYLFVALAVAVIAAAEMRLQSCLLLRLPPPPPPPLLVVVVLVVMISSDLSSWERSVSWTLSSTVSSAVLFSSPAPRLVAIYTVHSRHAFLPRPPTQHKPARTMHPSPAGKMAKYSAGWCWNIIPNLCRDT